MTRFIYFSLAAAALVKSQEVANNVPTETAEEPKADGFWNFLVNADGEIDRPAEEVVEEEVVIEEELAPAVVDEAVEEQVIDFENENVEGEEGEEQTEVAAEEEEEIVEEEQKPEEQTLPAEEIQVVADPVKIETFNTDYYQPTDTEPLFDQAGYPSYYLGARRFKNQPGFWSAYDNRKTWFANWKANYDNNRRVAYENRVNNYKKAAEQRINNYNSWKSRFANRPRPTYQWPRFSGYKTYENTVQVPEIPQEPERCPPGQIWSSWSNGCILAEAPKQEFYPAGHLYKGF